ncbi:hypothetical protein BG005_010489 [Podila minutissima]|nr:hypothetical protein BG005_010489 [Podila minutissima]
MTTTPTARSIQRIVQARGTADGVGTIVQRTIGGDDLESLDPFLTLDEFRMTKPTPSKGSKNPSSASKKEAAGFPDHPHRGFETVTLMLEGYFQHQDFTGRQGTIGPGDVQWMTAGRGIVHAEMPYFPEEETLSKKKGSSSIWGLQLWVNLPKKHKLCKPQYQDLKDEAIPRWTGPGSDGGDEAQLNQLEDLALADKDESESKLGKDNEKNSSAQTSEQETTTKTKNGHGHRGRREGISVKVIAGASHGVSSKVYTRTPTMYLEIKMQKHQTLTEWIPKEYEGFVYVLQGKARFGSSSQGQQLNKQAIVEGKPQQMLILSPSSPSDRTTLSRDMAETETRTSNSATDADQQEQSRAPFQSTSFLDIETMEETCHFVLIAGEPCREPVFRQGPFVMNSKEELERTFRDYEEKKRGFERAKDWVSTIGQQAPLSVPEMSQSSFSKSERGKGRNSGTLESADGSRKKPSENKRKGN